MTTRALIETIRAHAVAIIIVVVVVLGLVFGVIRLSRLELDIVFLFQNADELRATGGFLGSLSQVHTHGWRVSDVEFRDIYDLDAQIPEYLPAPTGVQRYLSGGQNTLHLQDANWWRDFQTSAATISALLVRAREREPDVIVAVNSTLAEKFLDYLATDGVTLTDPHGKILTSDNFTALARRDHDLLAAGRQPKTAFLRHFATQLTASWQAQTWSQRWQWGWFLYAQKSDRDWQAWSPHPLLEKMIAHAGAAGTLTQTRTCHDLYFVPSNVGINKSNHATAMSWPVPTLTTQSGSTRATYTVTISNDNPLDETALLTQRLIFADYQRLLLPPGVTLEQVSFNGETVDDFDIETFTDSRDQEWIEVGFLIQIREQEKGILEFSVSGDGQCWQLHN